MHIKRWAIGALIVALVATMAVVAVASAHNNSQSKAGEQSGIPRYQHVFVIMMENHSFAETYNNPATPYINSLANTYGLATDYFGVTHPSEPNYVASIGGSFFGIQDDAPYTTHTITSPSVAERRRPA
jgi:phospholipase C